MSMIYIAIGSDSDGAAMCRVEVKIQYLYDSLIGKEILGTKRSDGSQKRYKGEKMAEEIRYLFNRLQGHIKKGDFDDTGPLKAFDIMLKIDNAFMSGITDSPESGELRTQTTQLFREFIEAYYGKSM